MEQIKINEIDLQKKRANELINLIKENPDLPILPMVDTYCVHDVSHGYWLSKWGMANIDEYYISDERVFIKSEDYDELSEQWSDNNYEDYPEISDEDLEVIANTYVDSLPWVKAILVRINQL